MLTDDKGLIYLVQKDKHFKHFSRTRDTQPGDRISQHKPSDSSSYLPVRARLKPAFGPVPQLETAIPTRASEVDITHLVSVMQRNCFKSVGGGGRKKRISQANSL